MARGPCRPQAPRAGDPRLPSRARCATPRRLTLDSGRPGFGGRRGRGEGRGVESPREFGRRGLEAPSGACGSSGRRGRGGGDGWGSSLLGEAAAVAVAVQAGLPRLPAPAPVATPPAPAAARPSLPVAASNAIGAPRRPRRGPAPPAPRGPPWGSACRSRRGGRRGL